MHTVLHQRLTLFQKLEFDMNLINRKFCICDSFDVFLFSINEDSIVFYSIQGAIHKVRQAILNQF